MVSSCSACKAHRRAPCDEPHSAPGRPWKEMRSVSSRPTKTFSADHYWKFMEVEFFRKDARKRSLTVSHNVMISDDNKTDVFKGISKQWGFEHTLCAVS